ncbi:MAG: hypothetical protein IPM82_31725 [Saprospiraceae bacterium]|nr:hypothetical protein [Saprospiraceae bacterium]
MKVITIKFNDSAEWKFLLDLLKRLNFNFDWKEETIARKREEDPSSDLVSKLFGSYPSDRTSDDLVKSIYDARVNQTREISL